jgi:hypothetical protein
MVLTIQPADIDHSEFNLKRRYGRVQVQHRIREIEVEGAIVFD